MATRDKATEAKWREQLTPGAIVPVDRPCSGATPGPCADGLTPGGRR
jgi:hypothetical protein